MGKLPYSVYVIELSKKVYKEHAKFRDSNPQYNGVAQCLYVGMTSKNPKLRFAQHVQGVKSKKGKDISSSIVKKYGMYLRPSLYQHIPRLNKADALKMEEEVALALRKKGHAVWFN